MMMSLRGAYNKFIEQHSTTKMNLSKFCELRPPNVKLFDHLPHQVCLCSYHENVRLLLVALREHSSLSTEFSSFIEQVTCDATSKKCMTRECSTCVDLIDEFAPQSSSVILQDYQWKSTDSRIEKVVMTDTVDAVFNELKKQLSIFLLHTFVKRKQAASFDSLKNSCDGKSIVLQVDFSENATIAAQKEVQAANWHHAQATIFTTYTWINKKYKQPTGTTLRQRSSPLTLGSKRSTSSPLAPRSGNDLHHLHLDQKEVQAAHWHHTQATIFTTYTWIKKKYKQPTGTTLRQRSSPLTLGSKRSTSSPLAPRSGNDLHHLHLDQKEVQAAHWHHTQTTIFTTYTWIRKKYKQPTGTTLRQRSSPLTLGSKRSTSSPLAPRSDNDLHHLHLDQKEVQAAHWHHAQATIFTTYTWIRKKYKQPTGTTLRQRSSPLTLGSKRSTSSPLAPRSGNDLHHLHLDQKEVQAAHWHHAQATIFTTYTWINNATNFRMVVISDDLKHTKHSIFVFMQCIF